MQAVTVTNMRSQAVAIPGLGTVNAETTKSGFIESVVFDTDFYAYKDRTAAAGILVQDAAVSPSFTPTGYESVTAVATINNASRAVTVANATGQAYALTLMAASAVPADTIVYFYFTSGANDVNITRAGSDTIDGSSGTLALNTTTRVRRLKSDGVSAWTSV